MNNLWGVFFFMRCNFSFCFLTTSERLKVFRLNTRKPFHETYTINNSSLQRDHEITAQANLSDYEAEVHSHSVIIILSL